MDVKLENTIAELLRTDFERELFKAAVVNLDEPNVLSLNNFAYTIRELIRNFLEGLAPDDKVKGAPWYEEQFNSDGKVVITREQRMDYAIHGWLTKDFLNNVLSLDVSDTIKDLKDSISKMSKYTHITPKTFHVTDATKTMEASKMLGNLLRFLLDIKECKGRVRQAIIEDFSSQINDILTLETFDDIDILSTHSTIQDFTIEQINLKELGSVIEVEVHGQVHTRLQIGSDGDVRRDDGYVTYMDFPFVANCVADIQNQTGTIQYEEPEIHIDTYSYYE